MGLTTKLKLKLFELGENFKIFGSSDSVNHNMEIIDSAITTLEGIAKGRNQALAYNNYSDMVASLNLKDSTELSRGQNIYIGITGVPDLWIYSVEATNVPYTYVDDNTLVNSLQVNTTVQMGFYKVAMLETQKVDLTTVNEKIEAEVTRATNAENAINNNLNTKLLGLELKKVSGTTGTNGNWGGIIPYPNGFNINNTFVLGFNIILSTSIKLTTGYQSDQNSITNTVALLSDGIEVCGYGNTATKPVDVLLAKVSI